MRSPSQPPEATSPPRPGATQPARRWTWAIPAVVTLLAAVVPAVWWIGDVSWIQDEPRLLAKAFHANQRRTIETHGLNGNFGIPYGPLPTQFYQLLLLVTHDPLTLAAIRAGLCAAGTALGLIWLARSLRLNTWFATAVVLAPYVWNFHRILWDASFAVPIGAIALASYASFLRTSSRASLLTCIATTGALTVIHPQDLPLLLPIAAHALWRHRPALGRHYAGVAVILGVLLALNLAYARKVYYAAEWHVRHGSLTTEYPGTKSRAKSLLTPFLGGSILAGRQFAESDSALAGNPMLVRAAKVGSAVAYPLIWLGIGVIIVRQVRRWRGLNDGELDDPNDPTLRHARRAIFAIALAGLVLQVLLYGAMRMPAQPQYFFGTFALHVLFAWVGIDALSRVRLAWPVIVVYGLSVGYITVASAIQVHRHGYPRTFPRPTLANQVQVARELNRYADTSVLTDVHIYKQHPQSLRALRLLIPPAPGEARTTSGRLMIRYRSGPYGTGSAVELTELPPGTDRPQGAETMDVTPLPPDWEPAKW